MEARDSEHSTRFSRRVHARVKEDQFSEERVLDILSTTHRELKQWHNGTFRFIAYRRSHLCDGRTRSGKAHSSFTYYNCNFSYFFSSI